MQSLPIWIYWDNIESDKMPAYIELCIETIKKNCGPLFEVHLVNAKNVKDYLPKINPRYKDIRHEGSPIGHPKNTSVMTAYIRVQLLKTYGGVWMDADTILLKDLSFVWQDLGTDGFVACHKTKTINGISNGFIASAKNGVIINKYAAEQEALLKTRTEFKWGEIGLRMMSPIVFSNMDHCKLIDESLLHPIIWEDWQAFFRISSKVIMNEGVIAITLFNSLFKKSPYYEILFSDKDKVLKDEFLISFLLRKALQ